VGDPACDLIVAWNLLTAETRDVFRAALPVDATTWARGRGWATSVGLIALPYYQSTNPVLAGIARAPSMKPSLITSTAHDSDHDLQ
jgi:aminoglycoside phosphotransferase (APT) family kinase protein